MGGSGAVRVVLNLGWTRGLLLAGDVVINSSFATNIFMHNYRIPSSSCAPDRRTAYRSTEQLPACARDH